MGLHLTGRRQRATVMAQSLSEGFLTIAQASSASDLRNVTPKITTIEEGRVGRTIIESPIWSPVGPLADLAGAETIFRRVFVPEGIEVIDVHGEGLTTAVIDWRVSTTFRAAQGNAPMSAVFVTTALILGLIAVALLATGWAVRQITVLVKGADEALGGTLPLVAIAIVAIIGVGAFSAQKRGSK